MSETDTVILNVSDDDTSSIEEVSQPPALKRSKHVSKETNTRARGWCYTLNNYTTDQTVLYRHVDAVYHIFGKEKGEQGTPHLQGFIYFKNAKTFNQLKQLLPGNPHLEVVKDIEASILYCRKENDYWEQGTPPASPKQKGAMEQDRWAAIWDAAVSGNHEGLNKRDLVMHIRQMDYIYNRQMTRADLPTQPTLENYWYCGPSGAGKSRKARADAPNAYLKMCNKWWDGYQNEPDVLIEDFDIVHSVLVHHLKLWSDHYPFLGEKKGTTAKMRPLRIFITSNWHPEQIWTDPKDLEPILRRFKVVVFGNDAHLHIKPTPPKFILPQAETPGPGESAEEEDM